MNFFQAIASGFANYATFSGRAPRSEYWYWTLFIILSVIATIILDTTVFHIDIHDRHAVHPFYSLFALAVFLPSLAVAIRRLHDINRRGWWQLIALIPIIGPILLIIWQCKKGTAGDNRFGPDPLTV